MSPSTESLPSSGAEVTFEEAAQAVWAWLEETDLGQNDRLALELLKLGPLPVACLSPWVPADKLLVASQQAAMPLHYRQAYQERLGTVSELEPRLEVAAAKDTPVALLEKLVGALEPEVRALAQQNPSCPTTLVTLVEEQWAIASSEATDPEELTQLAQSPWPWIRRAVASNLAASEAALNRLAHDAVEAIQVAVAENPAATESVLSQLAEHPNLRIQTAVAENPGLPEALQLLFLGKMPQRIEGRRDLKLSVLEVIYQREAARADLPVWKNQTLQWMLLNNSDTSAELLAYLASAYEPVKIEAFHRQEADQANRTYSSDIYDSWVNQAANYLVRVLEHPNCSVELLKQIAEIEHEGIRFALLSHPKTPVPLLQKWGTELLQADRSGQSRDIEYELEKIAQNSRTPKVILEQLFDRYYIDNESRLIFINSQLREQISHRLYAALTEFWNLYKPPFRLLDTLRYEPKVRAKILRDWHTFQASFVGLEKQEFNWFCQIALRSHSQRYRFDSLEEIMQRQQRRFPKEDWAWMGGDPEAMMLFGFLKLIDFSGGESVEQFEGEEAVIVSLAWNPALSEEQRQKLQARLPPAKETIKDPRSHLRWRSLLAFNSLAPESDRMPYLQSMMKGSNEDKEQLARSSNTPVHVLQQLMLEPGNYLHFSLAENPSLPSSELINLLPKQCSRVFQNPAFQASDAISWLLDKANPVEISKEELQRLLPSNSHWSAKDRHRITLATRQHQQQRKAATILVQWPDRHLKAKQETARSWHTAPETLNTLAQDADVTIRQYVATNGKLAAAGQQRLARDSDMQVLLNLAQRRSHHTELDSAAAATLFERGDRAVHLALARNEKTPTEVIDSLYQLNDSEITALLLAHPNASLEILRQEIPKVQDVKRLGAILRDPHNNSINRRAMPPELLAQLASHEEKTIRFLVARQTSALPETLEKLSQDEDDLTRRTVAENPSTPPSVLIAMAKQEYQTSGSVSNYHSTGHTILRRKDAPTEALDWIARNPSRMSNTDVARHSNTSAETLGWIAAHDSDDGTLMMVAQNSKTSPEILAQLAEQGSENVRAAVAAQPNCPSHILPLELLSQQPSLKVCLNIATNPNTPAEYLEMFITSQKPALRAAVATNTSLSPEHLFTLAHDPTVEVRLAILRNPQTLAELMKELQSLQIPSHKQPTSSTLTALPQRYDPETHSEADLPELLRTYAQSDNAFIRFAALLNPHTPSEILSQAAQSSAWIERYAVADNPALPEDMRQQLQGDEQAWVRAIAKGPGAPSSSSAIAS